MNVVRTCQTTQVWGFSLAVSRQCLSIIHFHKTRQHSISCGAENMTVTSMFLVDLIVLALLVLVVVVVLVVAEIKKVKLV